MSGSQWKPPALPEEPHFQFYDESLLRTAGPGLLINFDASLEEFVLHTSNLSDSVTVVQMPVAAHVEIDQGGGQNVLVGPNLANLWQITETDLGSLNSTIHFENTANVVGGNSQDQFIFSETGSLSSTDGSDGTDLFDYTSFLTNVAVDQGAGTASNVTSTIASIETVHGGAGDDFFRGNSENNELLGGAGNDILLGLGGDDTLSGDGGRDLIFRGSDSDILQGGEDDDIVIHGRSIHAMNDAALMALLAEWIRTGLDSSYNVRVANLRNGGGLNGTTTLTAATVLADNAADLLSDQEGFDWFWAGPSIEDTLLDLEIGEELN
ncbi:MAG: hypothetical protein ABGX16_12060 [Pirellulales bacterium]